jgi:transaldolase
LKCEIGLGDTISARSAVVEGLDLKIFADGGTLDEMLALADDARIDGFTTNPTTMRQAGVRDYEAYARELLRRVRDRPICFEVLGDTLATMREEALLIASWGENVCVKVPITTSAGEPTADLLADLTERGVPLNVTAVTTLAQVAEAVDAIDSGPPGFVSILAGRIADSGVDPTPLVADASEITASSSATELIWASAREVLNVVQADRAGCHAITLTPALIARLDRLGRDPAQISLDTIRSFHEDALAAGLSI